MRVFGALVVAFLSAFAEESSPDMTGDWWDDIGIERLTLSGNGLAKRRSCHGVSEGTWRAREDGGVTVTWSPKMCAYPRLQHSDTSDFRRSERLLQFENRDGTLSSFRRGDVQEIEKSLAEALHEYVALNGALDSAKEPKKRYEARSAWEKRLPELRPKLDMAFLVIPEDRVDPEEARIALLERLAAAFHPADVPAVAKLKDIAGDEWTPETAGPASSPRIVQVEEVVREKGPEFDTLSVEFVVEDLEVAGPGAEARSFVSVFLDCGDTRGEGVLVEAICGEVRVRTTLRVPHSGETQTLNIRIWDETSGGCARMSREVPR